MNNLVWPVNVVMTGTPELIELDSQMVRRVEPIEAPQISYASDGGGVPVVLIHFTRIVSIEISDELVTPDFGMRLFHATGYEQGLVFEFVKRAIRVCLYCGHDELPVQHFARYFSIRCGAPDDRNPFLAPDFEGLDVKQLLPARKINIHGTTIQRAVSRWKKMGK